MKPMMPTAMMMTKANRQPNCWPMNVPNGTPVTVATVRPENMMDMALARRLAGTRSAAMVEPIDMKTPCDSAEITRAASRTLMLVALAAMLLPMMKTIMIHSDKVLRDMRDVRDVRTGAPNVTPRAYRETVSPAVVTGMCKSLAMSGSRPTLINSVVPIAKALTARASSANVLCCLFKGMNFPPHLCRFI